MIRHDERFLPLFARNRYPFGDGRNHVAGPLNPDRVSYAHILARDLVGVMQCRPADRHATDFHRLEKATGVSVPVRPTETTMS